MADSEFPAPVTRPDGRIYQPLKVIAYFVHDRDEIPCGVVVLGTHDIARATALASALVRDWDRGLKPVDPETVWWRDGFEGAERSWISDPERGRAAVWFRDIAEVTSEVISQKADRTSRL